MPDPQDPLSGMTAAAVGLHELFTSFTAAGFTEAQALYLIGKYVEGQARPNA